MLYGSESHPRGLYIPSLYLTMKVFEIVASGNNELGFFLSENEEQEKSDPAKCPTHLFVVSKSRQKIEVKPARKEDVKPLHPK